MLEHAEAIRDATTRGRMIYEQDRAGWLTTQELIQVLTEEQRLPIQGWVVEPLAESFLVTYYGLDGETPFVIASFHVEDGEITSSNMVLDDDSRPGMSANTRVLIAARTSAVEAMFAAETWFCREGFPATVTMPPDENGVISIYFLTTMGDDGAYPAGGHSRFDIGQDGTIISSRQFTNSCLQLAGPTEGPEPVAFVVAHLLDPHPTEIHVFLSLWTHLPLGVVTIDNGIIWSIEGEEVGISAWTDPTQSE